jgi:hypothetical protein
MPDPFYSIDIAPHIVVSGAGPVNISFIAIDGTGTTISDGSANEVGVFYGDASGTVNQVTVHHILIGGFSAAFWASATTSQSVTVLNSNVHDITNSSFIVAGTNITAKSNNLAPSGYNIQSEGSSNTISGNFLSGTGSYYGFNMGGSTTVTVGTLSANTVTNYQIGFFGHGPTVTKNLITNSTTGISLDGDATITSNIISKVGVGVEFNCISPTAVTGNLISEATTGLDFVPPGFSTGSNKFNDVATIRTGGCAAKSSPKGDFKLMRVPVH